MAFEFRNLDEETRKLMKEELELDLEKENLYISKRLNDKGKDIYPTLLKRAIECGTEATLAEQIRSNNLLNTTYRRKNASGYSDVKMPKNAAETLADGEFSRFYARAICLRAIRENKKEVRVYRAKNSVVLRKKSESKIGMKVNAEELIEDLRNNVGRETFLGIPNGPNSGLSVELVD
jgi:alpha-galactosidase/6-phospho-beta-glucosidase family protein